MLYTSGYGELEVARQVEAGATVAFLRKPYVPDTLALRVREVLDRHGI